MNNSNKPGFMLLVGALLAASFVVQPLGHQTSHHQARHHPVVARELAFNAKLEVTTEPFEMGEKPLGEFLAEEEGLRTLMSQAESCARTDANGPGAETQQWTVVASIPFPGMVATSETPMTVNIDKSTPRLSISSGDSKTVSEGGPPWAKALLARLGEIAKTTSSNVVEIRDAPGGDGKVCVSNVELKVALSIPTLLLPPFIPVGPFERAGSESLQKLLDQDMAPALKKFRDAYVAWSA